MSLSSLGHVALRIALRLYPKAWRQRYGDELSALLEGGSAGPREIFDLLHSAVHEQLTSSSRRRDSGSRMALRVLVAAGASLLLSISLLTPLAWVFPVRMSGVVVRDLWFMPFLGLLVVFVALSRLFSNHHRLVFFVTAVLISVVFGLGCLLSAHDAWSAVASWPTFVKNSIVLAPAAAMFGLQAALAFCILDWRRARLEPGERHAHEEAC